ncbi:MAG: FAD-dependent oxidoreductase [Xanthobacter sp.]
MSTITNKPADEPLDGLGPWKEYLCRACGYIYNERDGDPDSGIAPGTRFVDIPEDWYCPICGVRKQDFEPYERADFSAQAGDMQLPVSIGRRGPAGVVIIGAGIAGWAVAGAIRKRDPQMPITMITSCAGDVYHKPELAIAFARRLSPETLRRECGQDAARRMNVRLVRHTAVVGLSPLFRKVRTTRGTFPYDNLVIASGARGLLPKNIDPALCWRINHLDAWGGLHAALKGRACSVAIIGAGMVGCELAEDLARAGHKVQLASITAEPMDGFLPEPAGARVRQGLQGLGVDYLHIGAIRSATRGADDRVHLDLAGHGPLVVDQLVSAIGVATPERMFRAAGLAFDAGLVVNPQTLETSHEHIYALGDCISLSGAPCRFVEPILKQANCVAASLTGAVPCPYEHRAPVIRLKMKAAPVVIEGQICRDGVWRTVSESADRLVMEQHRNGEMIARLVA